MMIYTLLPTIGYSPCNSVYFLAVRKRWKYTPSAYTPSISRAVTSH